MRTVHATRYVTPLREGGSLPAIVEGDDDGLYVLKFVGAGQGPRALIAELVAGEIGRALGLPVPEIVFATIDADLARTEPDAEIQDLIRASARRLVHASAERADGTPATNLALDYLPGAVAFDPLAFRPDAELASCIVWFDAYLSNLDRTPRNANMLVWHHRLWLIDHGAALYFHHASAGFVDRAAMPFAAIKDHVLLPFASMLDDVDKALSAALTAEKIDAIASLIPDEWLADDAHVDKAAQRAAYSRYLTRRLEAPRAFAEEAERARSLHV
jgi:hypothetical protein